MCWCKAYTYTYTILILISLNLRLKLRAHLINPISNVIAKLKLSHKLRVLVLVLGALES
jgi:hypothetical protein